MDELPRIPYHNTNASVFLNHMIEVDYLQKATCRRLNPNDTRRATCEMLKDVLAGKTNPYSMSVEYYLLDQASMHGQSTENLLQSEAARELYLAIRRKERLMDFADKLGVSDDRVQVFGRLF